MQGEARQRLDSIFLFIVFAGAGISPLLGAKEAASAGEASGGPLREVVANYCLDCHDGELSRGKLDLEALLGQDFGPHSERWMKVAEMLRERKMPPEGKRRPDDADYEAAISWLEEALEPIAEPATPPLSETSAAAVVVEEYCISCHDAAMESGGLDLETALVEEPGQRPDIWERVVHMLNVRQMPPQGRSRPGEAGYEGAVAALSGSLDAATAAHPNPGRTESLRRMNRTEYANAIRDLLAIDIDADALLPADESSHGFDNVTVAHLSPVLLERYVDAAQKISQLAVGGTAMAPQGETVRLRPDLTQEKHVAGLPLGTRGGALVHHTFPRDGEYSIEIRLTRDRNEHVEGLNGQHQLDVLLDRSPVESFTVKPPTDRQDHSLVDAHLNCRVKVSAGPHDLGVTFVDRENSLLETKRQPYAAHFNMHRHPRLSPAVYEIAIVGPFDAGGPGDTPSRRRIFTCRPEARGEEESCARKILTTLMQRAYRRPVTDADLARPLAFFRERYAEDGFEAGIERAVSAVLVSPEFLFRIELDPPEAAPGAVYRISNLELASRLSFFLWSSIPDDCLLDAAIRGELSEPSVLEAQVRRMLADPRAGSLATNFAGQWLYLRNLESATPDLRLFPDFDDNLRQAFRRETELLFDTVQREDLSVLRLLDADYTFLNERLAKHYGIPHIYGDRFRRVELSPDSNRGGLLRQGSILTVTSYATRTSPVLRGNWVLKNLLGAPAPPPPPNVPALEESTIAADLPMRERLSEHRANPACASCHNLMDPIGFALENYDATGRWRNTENGRPLDVSGGLPGGFIFEGTAGLEAALLERPELFVSTLTEKLLTFALGRGMEYYDAPAIRAIVRESKASEYRFSAIVLGVVKSTPFQMRKAP